MTSQTSSAETAPTTEQLASDVEQHRDEIVARWLKLASDAAGRPLTELEPQLKGLLWGLVHVLRTSDWSVAQAVIGELAERRARVGTSVANGVRWALVTGFNAIRPFQKATGVTASAGEQILLALLHECLFRFLESYQGIMLETETQRMHSRIIKSLVTALEARDPYTKGHSVSVALTSQRVAQALDADLDPGRVQLVALLHDIGKVGIPDNILLKPGPLNEREWEIMQSHPRLATQILQPVRLYPDILDGVLSHHENYDGSGYAEGLAGEAIPLIARIIRVTDSFDAMTSARVYRPSYSVEEALTRLEQERGSTYDPEVVDAFSDVIRHPASLRDLSLASLEIDLSEAVFAQPLLAS